MNIQASINKLMLGIKQQGRQIKLETKIQYSEKNENFMKQYFLYENINGKWQSIYYGYSKIELLKRLVNSYKEGET